MTPKMLKALADAYPNGLARIGGGWQPRDRWGGIPDHAAKHATVTVRALIDRTLLQAYAHGTVVHLTELGEVRLREERAEAQS